MNNRMGNFLFQKRIDLGLSLHEAAKGMHISDALLDVLENKGVTHPNIAQRVKRYYKLTNDEYLQIIPKIHRPGDDYDPDKFRSWRDIPTKKGMFII